jgi:hypothetical protein
MTATGSSSPAIATSITVFSTARFVPKICSTICTDTPAAAAIERIVARA